MPVFLLASGLILIAAWLFISEQSQWNVWAIMELLYLGIFPALVAYVLWDFAMRKGNNVLVTSTSLAIPVVSTVITSLYLNVQVGRNLWIAALLVIFGAVTCKFSIIDKPKEAIR